MHPSDDLLVKFEANQYLCMTSEAAIKHYGTQGDGNHFFFVGRVASSGELAIVTHHGSRKPGALLYKAGMAKAESYRKKLAPEVPKHNAWIPADTQDGEDYWWALQLIREWTKGNHRAIHGAVADYLKLRVRDRFWNEHNFVFQKSDGLFYHAKGATPAYPYFSNDTDGRTLIPLNMAQPVLITEGLNADNGLGFAPHGAGRNYSRTQFMKTVGDRNQFIRDQTAGIDARFYTGRTDLSELPAAYKDANEVRRQIDKYGLTKVVDTIEPIGCIMAGESEWSRK
jgi:RNA-splicing ligase RtcB